MGRINSVDVGPPTALISLLRHEYGISTFVETGTYLGGTACWAGSVFDRVITIEASEHFYNKVVRKYSSVSNINFVCGDSRDKLRDVLKGLDGAALFWLDAHWSGGPTFGSGDECPLLEEIGIINNSEHEHFIFIDDARLFVSGPPKPHSVQQWPGIKDVFRALKNGRQHRYVLIWEDVIIAVPYRARDTVDEYCRSKRQSVEHGQMLVAAKTQSCHSGRDERSFMEQLVSDGLWTPGQSLRLHLGCGEKHLESYINIDFPPSQHPVQKSSVADLYADITKLKLPPGCVDEIRLHHLFEHFDRPTAMTLLCKWHRWLKTNGLLRIETPDILESARLISDTSCGYKQKQSVLRHIFGSNEAAWAVHKDGWYEEKFRHILDALGFADIRFDSSQWKMTHNITVTAKKARNIDSGRLAETAKNLLRDYLIDDSDSEQTLWRVWCKKLDEMLRDEAHPAGPAVSIFMAVRNEQKYLADTIESILKQSYTDFELVIVDDGSTDKTLEIAKSFQTRDKRIKLIASDHKGVVEARNLAIGSTHPDSKYLLNHDGDDISLPAKLERLVDYLQQNPDVDIVGCFAEYFDNDGNSRGFPAIGSEPAKIRDAFGQVNSMIHSASLMRREVVRQIGGYRDDFVPAEDYDFFAQALLAGFKLANIPEILHKIRLHPESIVSTKPKQLKNAAEKIGRYYDEQLSKNRRRRSVKPAKSLNESKSSLKILHTVEFYYPHIGGAEKVIQQLSERLVSRGHNVTVATTQLPDRTISELNGVKIQQFDVTGSRARGVRGTDVQRYKQFLLDSTADIVLNYAAQQWATDLAFETLDATAPGRVNIIAPCGYSALADSTHLQWPQFKEYFSQILPACLPKYDAAVYHSQSYQDYEFARNHGFGNSVVIPNGVCEEEFGSVPPVDFRRKYGITTKYLALSVANFYPGKGHDRIIECVRQMSRTDLTMVFIGRQGGELAGLRKLADGLNIQFCVDIDRQDTLAAYHQADIFLFGSQIECFPLVILEAKASRTAFVSTDCGNVSELAGGVVCPAEKMAHYANRILDDEQLRTTLAGDGLKEYAEKYTYSSVVDKYERLYLSLYRKKFGSGQTILSLPAARKKESAAEDKQITALVFSKDRAMQLQATIESFSLHCRDSDTAELVVLYKTSNDLHHGQYERLKTDFPNVSFIEEVDFNEQVVSIVARRKYILFAVDDNVFVKPFRLKDVIAGLAEQTDAVGFSLRLGKNTGFCYMLSAVQRMPDFTPPARGILNYNWTTAEHDFGYPLEVSSSLYRRGDVLELLGQKSFTNPNTLESMLSSNKELFKSKPYLLTFESSVTFCNPVNIVQNVYQNNKRAAAYSYTSEQLADSFSKGKRIDVEKYAGFTPNGAHQEVQLYFRPAGGASEKVTDEYGLGDESARRPEFSVVMANYDNARYICEAVESVLGQSFTDWELIIIDDCSTDNSLQIIDKYLTDNRIRLIRHETNKGYVAALKTGISSVRSRLFGILDSDDTLAENALAVMHRHHLASPDCGLIYSQFICCDENLKPQNAGFCRRIPEGLTSIDVDAVSHFKTFKLDYYLTTAGFDEAILYAEDKDIIYKMEEVGKLKFVDEPLYFYREVTQGQSHLPEKMAIGFKSKLNAQLNAIERRSQLDSPAGYFLEANERFMRGRFDLAAVLMRKYRLSANYAELPRTVVTAKKTPDIDVSVVIVTYNRTGDVVKCLQSLAEQDDRRFEIILVDNGGTDFDAVKAHIDRFVGCPVNFRLSEGRNIGACCAKGRILAFLDDDAVVGEDYIGSIKAAFETYDIAGLRGKALPKTSPGANNNAKRYDLGPNPFPTFCDLEGGSAFLRKVFLSMDGMDPLLFAHEGPDLTYRIAEKFGVLNKVIYWPYTAIYTDNLTGPAQQQKERAYRLIEVYLQLKHKRNIFVMRKAVEDNYLPGSPAARPPGLKKLRL